MPETSAGRVMVHCTDIAGSVGRNTGQVSGDDGLCRHAPNVTLIDKTHFPKPLPIFTQEASSDAVPS